VKSTKFGANSLQVNKINGEMKITQCVSLLENVVPDCGTLWIAQFMLKGTWCSLSQKQISVTHI